MARLSTFIYKLPCKKALVAHFPNKERLGLYLGISLSDGSWGIGEYAPFPGIHEKSIEDALFLAHTLDNKNIEDYFNNKFKDLDDEAFYYPLSFILSVAYWHKFFCESFLDLGNNIITLSGLITNHTVEDAIFDAKKFLAQGYNCLKIKVGKLALSEEIEKIKRINNLSEGKAVLRVDANKHYELKDAIMLAKGLKSANIAYIEEPCKDINKIGALVEECGIDIAFDESFKPGQDISLLEAYKARYVIIKASRFKSLFEVMNICKKARELNIVPIFSTCFESEFYCSLMALLAFKLELFESHGLYCPNFIEGQSSLKINQGSLKLKDALHVLKDEDYKLRKLFGIKHEIAAPFGRG